MSRARQFIKDYTRGCSNETTSIGSFDHTYHEWLTPEQALTAVEIAREELIEKFCEWLQGFMECSNLFEYQVPDSEQKKVIEDFKQSVKEQL